MGFYINELFNNEFQPCECCKIRYSSSTFTVSAPHKWTKEEIETRIMELAKEMADSKWYNRGNIRRQLKHWTEKLERYNEAKEEFNLK